MNGGLPPRRPRRLTLRAFRLHSAPLLLSLLVVLAVGVGIGVSMIAFGPSQLAAAVTTSTCSTGTGGYWQVTANGGVFAYGDAGFYGSAANIKLNAPIVGLVPTSDAKGYWLIASDGGVFAYGDAQFDGSMGRAKLNSPVVGAASTATGITCVGPAGAAGNTILNGTVLPAADVGRNGDFYLDTATSTLYGPKASGVWSTQGASLVGPAGANGATGPTGARGPVGNTGPQGPVGSTGPQGPVGSTGPQGPVGNTGPAGSPASSNVTGTVIVSGPANSTGIDYAAPSGPTPGTGNGGSPSGIEGTAPDVPITLDHLSVVSTAVVPAGGSIIFDLIVNGSSVGGVSCTIPAGSSSCTSDAPVTISPGDMYYFYVPTNGGSSSPTNADVAYGYQSVG